MKYIVTTILALALGGTLGWLFSPNPEPPFEPVVTVPEDYHSVPLPKTLFINGERWKVLETTFTGDTVGLTECDRRIIWYSKERAISELRDTMWHEIIHAANCKFEDDALANWKKAAKDSPTHDTVYKMASFLEGFVMSNPDYVHWAMDK